MGACICGHNMDRRIQLQRKSATKNARGEEVVTWTTYAVVWAEFIPLRGRELFSAQQLHATADARFRMRYRSDVNPEHRILLEGKAYDVRYAAEIPPRKSGL